MVTNPADGMAAAPIAARVAVNAITQMLPNPRTTPCACRGRGYAALLWKQGRVLYTPRKKCRFLKLVKSIRSTL